MSSLHMFRYYFVFKKKNESEDIVIGHRRELGTLSLMERP